MTPLGQEIALRAVGTALAGFSIAFAGYMLDQGGGRIRVNGMEHLAIFAQPRGTAPAARALVLPPLTQLDAPVDLTTTGSVDGVRPAATRRPVEIIAARADRVWLRIDGAIRAAVPGDDVPRVGHIASIVPRDGGWALLDDRGATLLTVAKQGNGASLFARKRIFE
ncbi:MAG: hypothetical protein JO312_12610 [Hyphomicrobiales bacterium]|nr:hypothetical protein [Hyphomicrobiales bacterium]